MLQSGKIRYALDKSRIVFLFPVEKVLQIVDKSRLLQNVLLSQGMQIKRVSKSLNKLQFKLKLCTVCSFWIEWCW